MSRRDQLIAVVLVAGLALAGFWFGLLSPKLKESKRLNTQLAAAQAERAQALASVAAAQAAESSYVSNVSTINSLAPAIPASDKTSSLLREIDKAANVANVNFTSITLASSGGGGGGGAAAGGAGGAGAGASGSASRFPTVPTPPVPPGYAATSSAGIPSVSYTLGFLGDYLKAQKFMAAMQRFVSINNGTIKAQGRLIDVLGMSVGVPTPGSTGNVSVSVVGYLLPASDQTPLPVPRNAPTVNPSSERAAAPVPGSAKPAAVAAAGKANS